MKITNLKNLPAPIYQAILANPYTKGTADASVTDLIDSPRLVALREAHSEELTSDASDQVWSLLGQAMHTVLERAGVIDGTGQTENRIYVSIGGWTVSGQYDYIDKEGLLWDWKFVGTYEYTHGIKANREQQLNLYALLADTTGVSVSGLRIGFVFRDWNQFSAIRDSAYPKSQCVEVTIPKWDTKRANDYLLDRVKKHQSARSAVAAGTEPEECTPEERWQKPEQWAVYKNGNKKASKLFVSEEDSNRYVVAMSATYPKDKYKVVHRPGESTRCLSFCPVLKWCAQGKKFTGTK